MKFLRQIVFLLFLLPEFVLPQPVLATEPMPMHLLRTIYTGVPQQTTLDEIKSYTNNPKTEFSGYVFGRSALIVLKNDLPSYEGSSTGLLSEALDQLVTRPAFIPTNLSGIPDGFGPDELVFTLVYAMVVSGQTETATDVLKNYMDSANPYTQAVVFQALRHIGTPRASGLLQSMSQKGADVNFIHNLMSDTYLPFLDDLRHFSPAIPPDQRDRNNLSRLAGKDCHEKSLLAIYFLGFLPESENHQQNLAELELLRRLTQSPCQMPRYFGVRALAVRSKESLPFWMGRYSSEKDPVIRSLIVRVMLIYFGGDFKDSSLLLLGNDPDQVVQWELLHGTLTLREGRRFRRYWDLWRDSNLQYALNTLPKGSEMSKRDREKIFEWLESGHRPKDPLVNRIMYSELAGVVQPDYTRRFLRLLYDLPKGKKDWSSISSLFDPRALPFLRYLLTVETDKNFREILDNQIKLLEPGVNERINHGEVPSCCYPTKACLLSQMEAHSLTGRGNRITNDKEARLWLNGKDLAEEADVTFTDPLQRVAEVHLGDRTEHWEHLYGCWVRVDPETEPQKALKSSDRQSPK